jgi:protein SCO1
MASRNRASRILAAGTGVAFLAIAGALPSAAGLLGSAIEAVGGSPPPNAQVPTGLSFVDETGAPRTLAQAIAGRPAVLILADYTCRTLCGPVLAQAAAALDRSGLSPGADFRLVAIGLDAGDRPADAQAMKSAQVGEGGALARATTFLTGEQATIDAVTSALGYRFAYDSANDQFAHPAAVFVLAGDGRLTRALSGLVIDPAELRLALVEAGEGRIGSIADRVRLLCYGFDPAAGTYTLYVHRLLALGWLVTAAGVAGGIAVMSRKGRRAGT